MVAGLTLGVASSRSDVVTTFGSTSTVARSWISGGLYFSPPGDHGRHRPSGSIAVVVTCLGVVWLAPDWRLAGGPALVRSMAMVVVPFVPLVIHLLLSYPRGRIEVVRPRSPRRRIFSRLAASVRPHRWDPFRDRYCWSNCSDNVFLAVRPAATHAILEFL